ncbi:hypothetical protein ACIRBY_26215 [Streptomyces sp. NPDC096136]|uniref:hypothetical protein n=1 Tax=Streptomyces sp. NPDC096136 TaxID=3366076 RepID=UPI0037F297B3
MPSRRRLPLWVPVLLLAAGCVTVRPPAPVEAPRQEPAAVRTAGTPRPPAAEGLPLGPAPEPQDAPPPAEEAAPVRAPEPEAVPVRPAPAAPHRSDGRPPRRASPARPTHRAPAAKPRARQPAHPAPRPAPRRSYDMSALCEAAKGRVDPAIVALCR